MSADFLDSNVFVYLFDETDPAKRAVADRLVFKALSDGSGVISFQVVQETLNVVTRKTSEPMAPEDAKVFLNNVLAPLWKVMPTLEIYERALEIRGRFPFSFYDSLIISAALKVGCTRLLSEDLQDGQKIDSLTITNPFTV